MFEIMVLQGQHVGKEVIPWAVKLLETMVDRHEIPANIVPVEGSLAAPELLEQLRVGMIALTGPMTLDEKSALLDPKNALPLELILRTGVCYETLLPLSPLKTEHIEKGFDLLVAYPAEDPTDSTVRLAKTLAQRRRQGFATTQHHPLLAEERVITGGQLATQLLYNQEQFDVLYTDRISGELLATLAGELSGTPQHQATAWIGDNGLPGIYEATSSMQQLQAGKGTANPVSAFEAVALLLRHSLNAPQAALEVEEAIKAMFAVGARTVDLAPKDPFVATTEEMSAMIFDTL